MGKANDKEIIFEAYKAKIMKCAEKHAGWIKTRGESRLKLRQSAWNDIERLMLSIVDRRRLYVAYVRRVDELAPAVIAKAPTRPRIAVSSL